jgi:hypothetical protein
MKKIDPFAPMKRIISYGDSFTLGLGTDRKVEEQLFQSAKNRQEGKDKQRKFEINNSFTKFFADKFKVPFINTAVPGCNNKYILNEIMKYDMDKGFEKDDFVLIGFTSSYRDKLPFFPDIYNDNVRHGFQWSMKELPLLSDPKDIFFWKSDLSEDYQNTLNEFMIGYQKFYMVEVFDDSYWQIFNSNIIVYIQKYLEFKKINYIMIDAFEPMLNDIPEFIDTKYYWKCSKENIWSYLKTFNDRDLFEIHGYNINNLVPNHPSKEGHKLFAEELYRFYNEVY